MSIDYFREKPLSQESSAQARTVVFHYTAYPSVDYEEAQAAGMVLTPASILSPWGTLYRQDVLAEPESADQWHVTVPYGPQQRVTGSFTLSFDTTGGTVNRKVSIGTVNSYKATAEATEPPDYKGAIGVQDDGSVNGAETVLPALKLSCHFKHPMGIITHPQIKAIARAVGAVNLTTFLTYEPGEVLFLGATGQEGTDTETEITYQFACSENLSGVTLGPFTSVTKDGWDHAWIKFKSEVDGGNPVVQPRWLYVEKVYYRKNLVAILGFGG